MNQSRPYFIALFSVIGACFLAGSTARAQNDRLYLKNIKKAKMGTVVSTNKDGVQFKTGTNPESISATEIDRIEFDQEGGDLTKGRKFALDGQYEMAMADLAKVNPATLQRSSMKADAAFYQMMSQARMALGGRGDKTKAIGSAMGFARSYSDSWHFYDAAKILGDLSLAINDTKRAQTFYGSLGKAESLDIRIESAYLLGITKLAAGNAAGALVDFEKIVGVKATNPELLRLQVLAKAGKAVALARTGKGAEGLKLVNSLIAVLDPNDIEMAARIYNAQGASFEAAGDTEGAIMAYLHTHLLFSGQPDAHAEALSKLVVLWDKVGKPDRAAEARKELNEKYPGAAK